MKSNMVERNCQLVMENTGLKYKRGNKGAGPVVQSATRTT